MVHPRSPAQQLGSRACWSLILARRLSGVIVPSTRWTLQTPQSVTGSPVVITIHSRFRGSQLASRFLLSRSRKHFTRWAHRADSASAVVVILGMGVDVGVGEGVGVGVSPNPPKDRDGRREDSGSGEGVTGAMIRARIWVDGRLGGGLQALLGAPMAAYSGCGEGDGGIGHGKRRSRTGLARVCGDVGLAGGSVADGRRQAGSGMARSRARARLNCSSQGQRRGRCRVNGRAERVIRPAKAKTRRLRVLVVRMC